MIHRKVKGKLNGRKGMRRWAIILTFVETAKMRGLDPIEEIRKVLEEPCPAVA